MARIRFDYGFATEADEIVRGVDLSGRRFVVTGAASGIGVETARSLARAGAAVTVAVRSPEAGRRVAEAIIAETGNPRLDVRPLDLADRRSVAAFAAGWAGPLHGLVNNAGIMATPTLERTPEGVEMQFATNHLGHFMLALGLRRALAAAGGARIVAVSSSANLLAPVFFDDPGFAFLPYEPFLAYGQSKTANALFAVEATRRWADDGILANALNPGAIATGLQKHIGGLRTPPEGRKTPQQGAATSVLLAASPLVEGIGGRYFEDCQEAETVTHRGPEWRGVAPYALDPANAERLWRLSEAMLAA
ncbi:SDR family NAD(P)-dependent oxidoreductase [Salinarimonas soli]|uniref:Probable oxidoreductase n=1 Tax=Salinarimonas soli TaxID=1638099 RepID=A0A5B2VDZ4_9HYPH|nr:SDR family NAD(P)-dependent oxidoreductase [Salinarimonas soli]KAA2236642.1 SDR family NAD(P)-dependent oxidoreductase [Salinarimonas soli]